MHSIPSDHYPPTPYSVDLSSPTSSDHSASTVTSNNTYNTTNMGYVPEASNGKIDIPLHELIGAAEAVEADLLESIRVEKAMSADVVSAFSSRALEDKPKNMASSTCSTSSSINTWKREESLKQQQQSCSNQADSAEPAEIAAPSHAASAVGAVGAVPAPTKIASATCGNSPKLPATGGSGYNSKQLQRCLQDACSDWFENKKRSPLGYPLNRLKRRSRHLLAERSPSPPCLTNTTTQEDEANHELCGRCIVFIC